MVEGNMDKCPKCGKPKENHMSQCDDCFDAIFKGPRPPTVEFSQTNNPEDWSTTKEAGSLTLDDLNRLYKQCTVGPAMQAPPCKVCDKEATVMVPGDGFYCKWHTPGDVDVQEFPKG